MYFYKKNIFKNNFNYISKQTIKDLGAPKMLS